MSASTNASPTPTTYGPWKEVSPKKTWNDTNYKHLLLVTSEELKSLELSMKNELGVERIMGENFAKVSVVKDPLDRAIAAFRAINAHHLAGSRWGDDMPTNFEESLKICLHELAKKVNTQAKRINRKTEDQMKADDRGRSKTPVQEVQSRTSSRTSSVPGLTRLRLGEPAADEGNHAIRC